LVPLALLLKMLILELERQSEVFKEHLMMYSFVLVQMVKLKLH
jgi:hypothetical protein